MVGYLDVEQARDRSDLRLVLTAGVPGPWGEAAKAFFSVKGLNYTPVRQDGGGENLALAEWTGQTSAPVAILPGEAPHTTLRQILFLAERLEPEPRLVPARPDDRALLLGLCGEIHLEMGLGWCRRLMMFEPILEAVPAGDPSIEAIERLAKKFGYYPGCGALARIRIIEILGALSHRLDEQQNRDSDFLFGDSLSALDLIWAAFSNLVAPLAAEQCPMPDHLRTMYTVNDEEVLGATSPSLLEHRDRIFRDVIGLPLSF